MELNDELISKVILFWSQFDQRPWSMLTEQERQKVTTIYLTKLELDDIDFSLIFNK